MAVETFTIEEQIKYYREESREEGFESGVEFSILKMLKRNMPVNEICEIMDLTHEQVIAIKNKMNK
jgi:hypothetical protein